MDLLLMGGKIKAERNRLNLTLETLSEQIGLSRNYLWEIEAGRKAPSLNTLCNLGIALNVSVDYLLGISAERKSIGGDPPITERDSKIMQITKSLDQCEIDGLSFILDIISDFLRYYEKK